MAEVSLNAVEKTYPNGFKAIHGIDIRIADGELIVLVGPSGCGKSTLLRMVAGLETVTGGDVQIGGRVVNDLEPADRDIAMVFQNYALYPHMNVFGNMAYGLKNRGMAKDDIAKRVADTAKILELDALLDRRPRQLSGGQRQRVAMGRAIVREPAAFLFDEPLSNLDAKLRVQMRIEIKKLQQQLGTTSLYVTHDQVEAMTMADRLVVMNAGRAEQIGTPLEVYRTPATTFVASFIGSPAMNFVPAEADGGVLRFRNGGTLKAPDNAPAGPVTLGIRPEHVRLSDNQENGSGGDFNLTVELVEPLGADSLIHGRLTEADADFTLRLAGISDIARGTQLVLSADPAHLHLFDVTSGGRIG